MAGNDDPSQDYPSKKLNWEANAVGDGISKGWWMVCSPKVITQKVFGSFKSSGVLEADDGSVAIKQEPRDTNSSQQPFDQAPRRKGLSGNGANNSNGKSGNNASAQQSSAQASQAEPLSRNGVNSSDEDPWKDISVKSHFIPTRQQNLFRNEEASLNPPRPGRVPHVARLPLMDLETFTRQVDENRSAEHKASQERVSERVSKEGERPEDDDETASDDSGSNKSGSEEDSDVEIPWSSSPERPARGKQLPPDSDDSEESVEETEEIASAQHSTQMPKISTTSSTDLLARGKELSPDNSDTEESWKEVEENPSMSEFTQLSKTTGSSSPEQSARGKQLPPDGSDSERSSNEVEESASALQFTQLPWKLARSSPDPLTRGEQLSPVSRDSEESLKEDQEVASSIPLTQLPKKSGSERVLTLSSNNVTRSVRSASTDSEVSMREEEELLTQPFTQLPMKSRDNRTTSNLPLNVGMKATTSGRDTQMHKTQQSARGGSKPFLEDESLDQKNMENAPSLISSPPVAPSPNSKSPNTRSLSNKLRRALEDDIDADGEDEEEPEMEMVVPDALSSLTRPISQVYRSPYAHNVENRHKSRTSDDVVVPRSQNTTFDSEVPESSAEKPRSGGKRSIPGQANPRLVGNLTKKPNPRSGPNDSVIEDPISLGQQFRREFFEERGKERMNQQVNIARCEEDGVAKAASGHFEQAGRRRRRLVQETNESDKRRIDQALQQSEQMRKNPKKRSSPDMLSEAKRRKFSPNSTLIEPSASTTNGAPQQETKAGTTNTAPQQETVQASSAPAVPNPPQSKIPLLNKFREAYPEYKASEDHFILRCTRIRALVSENRMVHRLLWDDFVMRHYLDYHEYTSKCVQAGEDTFLPYETFYNDRIEQAKFTKGILNPSNIAEVHPSSGRTEGTSTISPVDRTSASILPSMPPVDEKPGAIQVTETPSTIQASAPPARNDPLPASPAAVSVPVSRDDLSTRPPVPTVMTSSRREPLPSTASITQSGNGSLSAAPAAATVLLSRKDSSARPFDAGIGETVRDSALPASSSAAITTPSRNGPPPSSAAAIGPLSSPSAKRSGRSLPWKSSESTPVASGPTQIPSSTAPMPRSAPGPVRQPSGLKRTFSSTLPGGEAQTRSTEPASGGQAPNWKRARLSTGDMGSLQRSPSSSGMVPRSSQAGSPGTARRSNSVRMSGINPFKAFAKK